MSTRRERPSPHTLVRPLRPGGAAPAGARSRGLLRCAPREVPRTFGPGVAGARLRLLVQHKDKWVNGTLLRYAFFESSGTFKPWAGTDALRTQVRKAFKRWKDVGIGLDFEEVTERAQAHVRIGFLAGDGHWSYVGRQILNEGVDDRTMNLDPTDGIAQGDYGVDVACHELGHTLGFPHEHQNPKAGIVWDEEAVYRALAAPPNSWSRQTTYDNIIKKLAPDSVQGSSWDPDSVMHYPFEPGLVLQPETYRLNGIQPAGGLSPRDREWVKTFYPALAAKDHEVLPRHTARKLAIAAGQQVNLLLRPTATRYHEMRTFGESDTVMVLFERDAQKKEVYLTTDDDGGEDRNAYIRRRLHAGREYVLRLRLYYASSSGDTSVMWW